MATTDASYSFTLRVKPSASNSYKIGIPFCPASFFDESTINLKIVWGDGSSDTELTTVASATDNILLEHTYSNATMKTIEIHGGYGADSNFEGGKIAFPQSSKHDAYGIAQDQAVPTGSTLDKISQLIFEKVANGKPVTGFYIHGQGDFQNFTKFWSHSTLTQLRNFIWSSDPATEIKHVGDKNFGYICFDKTFENCHTGFGYTANSNHALYPTAFKTPLNGGGWQNASRRSKSYQRTFANSKVNSGISGWGPSRFAKSTKEMFKDNTVFSRNINKLFATGNPNSLINMEGMFENTQAFSKHMLNWNTSKVTNMINVFKNSKYDRRLDTWDVAKVTSMKGFLEGNTDYASGDGGDFRDIKEWFDPYLNPDGSKRDASNPRTFAIESLESIFKDSAVNVDISTWNTSTVTNMKNVFNGNTAFDQDISDWDTTNVSTENLDGFATGATGLTASEVPSSVPSDSVAADSSSNDSSSGETTSMFNFFGTTSTSYSNVYGSSVTNGETSIFDSTYSSDVSNGVTFSPVTDTSDIPNYNSHVEDAYPDFTISSSFKLASSTNGNGDENGRVSLQKLWDDQIDGEGWNPETDGDVDIATVGFSDDGISKPMFYLDEDIGLFFKRVSERALTIDSVSTEARFFEGEDSSSTETYLSDNDDLSDGDYLVIYQGSSSSLYRRNSNSTGDGTFGYYSGWTDEGFMGTNYDVIGDEPDKIKYSLSNMTGTVPVGGTLTDTTNRIASVNLNGDTLEFKVDLGHSHTISGLIASLAADYNDQTETVWDFGVVKIENS